LLAGMCETGGFAHSLHGRIYGDPDNKRRSTPLLRPGQQVAIRSFVAPRTAIMVLCPYDRTNRLLDAGTDHKRSPHAELGAPTSFATNHTPKIDATTANKYAQRARPHVSSAKVGPDRIPPETAVERYKRLFEILTLCCVEFARSSIVVHKCVWIWVLVSLGGRNNETTAYAFD
jgi:hypothetical protein